MNMATIITRSFLGVILYLIAGINGLTLGK